VGRKAALLGWAHAQGLPTPGGLVLLAERFWDAIEACGVLGQARYLEASALRLDPAQALAVGSSITEGMRSPALDALAAADAGAAFAELGGAPVVCRSSSAMEDGRAAAFPGVFVSVLGIGTPAVLAGAIATCWRSAFSPAALGYLLRMGTEPLDFSLALLLQRQVEARWYGVYVSVDPLTGAPEPQADLSDDAPDALVAGGAATLRARRRSGRWAGVEGVAGVATALESVHRAAQHLGERLGAEVDVEFAVPAAGAEPVILQCRPLTTVGRATSAAPPAAPGALRGRPCAAGRATGVVGQPGGIAVVEHLTPADYGVVLAHAGVVTERDASPLSHVAVLCRELGVPFVAGVAGARAQLAGRLVAVDGEAGTVELVAAPDERPRPAAEPSSTEPALSSVELLLRVLAEGRAGQPPAEEAERILRRYARALGGVSVRVVASPIDHDERGVLDRLGARLLGPGFSTGQFL
jgi:phosphoenolpyruvate synthase/pyruvate phosphate dikinase